MRHAPTLVGVATAIAVTLVGLIFIYHVHRIRTVADVLKIHDVLSKPNDGPRCKRHNGTHYVCLPNVFLIGASKCGTTSLLDYLLQDPRVAHVRRRITPTDHHREVHRFDRQSYAWAWPAVELADEWASSPVVADKAAAVVHYTPHYLYAPTVPFEMRRFYPQPETLKFIVSLREPVARALSSYWFQHSHLLRGADGGSVADFEALARGEMQARRRYDRCMADQLQRHRATIDRRSVGSDSSGFRTNDAHYAALTVCFGGELRSRRLGSRHIDKGIYHDQIQRWWANFPRANFHFISLEQWARNASAEYHRLLSFLFDGDVAPPGAWHTPQLDRKRLVRPNARAQDPHQQLAPAFRQQLLDFYAPYNAWLQRMVGFNFSALPHA